MARVETPAERTKWISGRLLTKRTVYRSTLALGGVEKGMTTPLAEGEFGILRRINNDNNVFEELATEVGYSVPEYPS